MTVGANIYNSNNNFASSDIYFASIVPPFRVNSVRVCVPKQFSEDFPLLYSE